MLEQQKILRVFKLIKLLNDTPKRNAKELAKLLDCTDKSVYRYIKLLEELGYFIDKNDYNQYFIFESVNDNTATFAFEETALLNNLIASISDEHPLKQSLKLKIFSSSQLLPFADELVDKTLAKIISQLNEAIAGNYQVKLLKYESLSSQTIKDRVVEPISLVRASSQLEAFDIESQMVKHFKIKRISGVEVYTTQNNHVSSQHATDLFGFMGKEAIAIKLEMSALAAKLLIEEYPESRIYLQKMDNQKYFFTYEVRNFKGVSRFILGLIGEIKIIEPQELKDFVKEKLNQASSLTS